MVGKPDAPEHPRRSIEDVDATRAGGVDIAFAIHLHAVRVAGFASLQLHPFTRLRKGAVGVHVVHIELVDAGIVHVEQFLVWREREPVGITDGAGYQAHRLAIG